MKNFKPNWLVGLAALIIAISVAYYFVWYLPNNAKNKDEIETIKRTKSYYNQAQLDTCLKDIDKQALDFWNKNCKERNLKNDCSLPTEIADRIDQFRKDEREVCFKRYPTQ